MADAQRQPVSAVLEVHDARPGAASRVSRSAGQAGGALVLLELAAAFGWLGSGDWSDAQWRAVTAAAVFATAVAQNVIGWWRAR